MQQKYFSDSLLKIFINKSRSLNKSFIYIKYLKLTYIQILSYKLIILLTSLKI